MAKESKNYSDRAPWLPGMGPSQKHIEAAEGEKVTDEAAEPELDLGGVDKTAHTQDHDDEIAADYGWKRNK